MFSWEPGVRICSCMIFRSLASQPPPAGSTTRCINLPNIHFIANSTYDIVVSDDAFFNGVLPLDVLKDLALTHAKDLGITNSQIQAALGPGGILSSQPQVALGPVGARGDGPVLGVDSPPILGGDNDDVNQPPLGPPGGSGGASGLKAVRNPTLGI